MVSGDSRIEETEKDQTEKYQDLRMELQKIWNAKVKNIPLVVGCLGAIPNQFVNRFKKISITAGTNQAHKTARILTQFLEI